MCCCVLVEPACGPQAATAAVVAHMAMTCHVRFICSPLSLATALLPQRAGRGEAFRAEALAVEVTMQSVDGNEGVQAFVERRPAEFVGW